MLAFMYAVISIMSGCVCGMRMLGTSNREEMGTFAYVYGTEIYSPLWS